MVAVCGAAIVLLCRVRVLWYSGIVPGGVRVRRNPTRRYTDVETERDMVDNVFDFGSMCMQTRTPCTSLWACRGNERTLTGCCKSV